MQVKPEEEKSAQWRECWDGERFALHLLELEHPGTPMFGPKQLKRPWSEIDSAASLT